MGFILYPVGSCPTSDMNVLLILLLYIYIYFFFFLQTANVGEEELQNDLREPGGRCYRVPLVPRWSALRHCSLCPEVTSWERVRQNNK